MKIADHATNKAGFTLVESLVVLTILLVITGFIARFVYRDELREVDQWFAETFGFSHLWVNATAITFYVAYRIMTGKKKRARCDRLTLPND